METALALLVHSKSKTTPENCSSPFFFGMPSTSAKLLREQLDDNFAARPGNFQSNFATIGFGA